VRTIAIIDDEASARIILRGFIEKFFPQYNVIGEADSVEGGVQLLQNSQPALVFLDIQLNSGTGFNILEALGEYNFQVVFVTAYENFAIEAFRFAAMDYLLKPLRINDLRSALQRFEERTGSNVHKVQTRTFVENLNVEDLRKGKIVLPVLMVLKLLIFRRLLDLNRIEIIQEYTKRMDRNVL
jgi:two-component system, LytTR family, response regulator